MTRPKDPLKLGLGLISDSQREQIEKAVAKQTKQIRKNLGLKATA